MSTKRQNPETIAIHGGDYRSDPTTKAVAVPIYRTTSYQFDSTEHAANLFALKELVPIDKLLFPVVLPKPAFTPKNVLFCPVVLL